MDLTKDVALPSRVCNKLGRERVGKVMKLQREALNSALP